MHEFRPGKNTRKSKTLAMGRQAPSRRSWALSKWPIAPAPTVSEADCKNSRSALRVEFRRCAPGTTAASATCPQRIATDRPAEPPGNQSGDPMNPTDQIRGVSRRNSLTTSAASTMTLTLLEQTRKPAMPSRPSSIPAAAAAPPPAATPAPPTPSKTASNGSASAPSRNTPNSCRRAPSPMR